MLASPAERDYKAAILPHYFGGRCYRFGTTYQFSRGIQTGGAGPSLLANWNMTSAVAAKMIGRNWTGVASRIVGLMWEGQDYGKHNLNQLDAATPTSVLTNVLQHRFFKLGGHISF